LARTLRLFSHNRWNLFSFRDTDFGPVPGVPRTSLRDHVAQQLEKNGIFQTPRRIRLLCNPRLLGYTFNPLSVYYCYDEADRVYAIVYEVHNTFHERRVYALRVDRSEAGDSWIQQTCRKEMYVSPFVPADMRYDFRLNEPARKLVIAIHVSDENGLMLNASLTGERQTISDAVLLRCAFLNPMMTFKIIAGIHYEAFRLWLKRVPWFSHRTETAS
jgi:DUF1365 family protein